MKIIAFYEDQWMAPQTDYQQWHHLAMAYDADMQMIRDWSEATIPDGHDVVVVDEAGEFDSATTFVIPTDAVYVFGRSGQVLTNDVPEHDASVKVTTPNTVSLFGIAAASMLMRDLQWRSP